MTIEITEFKCPSCGHLIGEEEYNNICKNHSRQIIEKAEEISREKIYEVDVQYKKLIREKELNKESEIQKRVGEILPKERAAMESAYRKDQAEKDKQYHEELSEKGRQLEAAREDIDKQANERMAQWQDEILSRANNKEARHEQIESDLRKQLSRAQEDNRKLQKTLETFNPERIGTATEDDLYEELHNAFPRDAIEKKKVGKNMADIVQTIVLENGEKIAPPIAWDRKTGDKISKEDIRKAKEYKTVHNTDHSIIVTTAITEDDSNNGFIGTREEILLVHPKMVLQIAKQLRGSIIKMAKLEMNNSARCLKQDRLYDFMISSEYGRIINTPKEIKSNLDDLQRKEEDYHKKTWKTRDNYIQQWFKSQQELQEKIEEIIQDQTNEQSEYTPMEQEKGDDTENN
jgi:DNA repair exonuclease SbcCD ATPase subunit